MDKQEYYYNGEYVTIFAEVVDNKDLVIVTNGNDYDELSVARIKDLKKKEDTYQWKKNLERKKELEDLVSKAKADMDKIADKVVDKALIALASRMKFNAVFGKDMGNSVGWAVMISQELEKIIKEKTPEIISKKGLPF